MTTYDELCMGTMREVCNAYRDREISLSEYVDLMADHVYEKNDAMDIADEIDAKLASDNNYVCGHCGYEGPCYGKPHGGDGGVSAPWCTKCERNDKLTKKDVNK